MSLFVSVGGNGREGLLFIDGYKRTTRKEMIHAEPYMIDPTTILL